MEITPEQFKRIEHCLPVQRGNVIRERLSPKLVRELVGGNKHQPLQRLIR
jgi:hypothetical protein